MSPTVRTRRRPLTADVVAAHHADVERVVRHILATYPTSRVAAHDLTATVWERLTRYGLPDDDQPLGPYIRSVTRRVAHDTLTRETRPVPEPLPGLNVPQPDDLTVDAARTAWLRHAISELPAPRQYAFTAVVLHGRTRASVARDLGITRQRVGQLVTAALADLTAAARRDGWAQ